MRVLYIFFRLTKCLCELNNPAFCEEDSGFIREKHMLPIQRLHFGDTGHREEEGYLTVGPLTCFQSMYFY